jgi:hypothetical protein
MKKKFHENMKVPGFCRVTPDVLLGFIYEITEIFQYTSIYHFVSNALDSLVFPKWRDFSAKWKVSFRKKVSFNTKMIT